MRRRATVLAYHAVGECPHRERVHNCVCISTEAFAGHMRFLARARQVISLEDLVEGRFSARRPAVAITFDDGYRNVLTNAAPILARYGFTATMFVPTKWIGQKNFWDSHTDCFPLEIADGCDLRAAEKLGISVESHGHAHIDLEACDPDIVADDLSSSIGCLREALGRSPRYLAYPYGRQSRVTQACAAEAGFSHAFLFDGFEGGQFTQERVSVDGREGRLRFRLKTAGNYLARRNSRLGGLTARIVRFFYPIPG